MLRTGDSFAAPGDAPGRIFCRAGGITLFSVPTHHTHSIPPLPFLANIFRSFFLSVSETEDRIKSFLLKCFLLGRKSLLRIPHHIRIENSSRIVCTFGFRISLPSCLVSILTLKIFLLHRWISHDCGVLIQITLRNSNLKLPLVPIVEIKLSNSNLNLPSFPSLRLC